MPYSFYRVGFKVDQCFDFCPVLIPENKTGTLKRSEKIRHRRELTALYIFKQDRRSLMFKHTQMNSCHLQVRIYLLFNADQMAVFLEIGNAGL